MAAVIEIETSEVEMVGCITTTKKIREEKMEMDDEMIQSLVNALKDYKSICEFNSIDFSTDKVKLYEEVREDHGSVASRELWPSKGFNTSKSHKRNVEKRIQLLQPEV